MDDFTLLFYTQKDYMIVFDLHLTQQGTMHG